MHGRAPFGGPAFGAFPGGPSAHQSPFGTSYHSPFGAPSTIPKVFYLFTAPGKMHEPHWSQTPMPGPNGRAGALLETGCTEKVGWCHGYVYYIMGHEEDFE
jgi:hypothetical protein